MALVATTVAMALGLLVASAKNPATRVVLGTNRPMAQYSHHACHCRVAECAAAPVADRPTSLYDMTDAANLSERA